MSKLSVILLYIFISGKEAPKPTKAATAKPPQAAETTTETNNSEYKCPEYYKYDDYSFYDIENEMQSSRIEQPSALWDLKTSICLFKGGLFDFRIAQSSDPVLFFLAYEKIFLCLFYDNFFISKIERIREAVQQ